MRRKFAGLTALLLFVSMIGLEENEGGSRRRARRMCCPSAPILCTAPVHCFEALIECPQTLSGTTTVGSSTFYTYTCDECGCGTSCKDEGTTTPNTYGTDLGTNPNLLCTDYSCVGSMWKSSNDPNGYCKVIPGNAISFSPFSKNERRGGWRVNETHTGRTGIPEFADGATFKPGTNITVTTIAKFPFMKGDAARYAVVYVLYSVKSPKALYAVGFELKDAPADGAGVDTFQPDSAAVPNLYETSVAAKNKSTGKVDVVKLQIYTRRAP